MTANNVQYFVIRDGEDGISIDVMSQEEIAKKLEPESHGECNYWGDPAILDHMPPTSQGQFDERGLPAHCMVIVKGTVVVPRPVTVVTKFEVP